MRFSPEVIEEMEVSLSTDHYLPAGGHYRSSDRQSQRTTVGRIYVGDVLPAHQARISGQIEAMHGENIDFVQLVLGYKKVPKTPQKWDPFTEVIAAPSVWRMFRESLEWCNRTRPEVVHLHALWAGLIGGLMGRLAKHRPVILYEIHGAVAFESRLRHGSIQGILRFILIYILESLAILLADRLLLVSEEISWYYPLARLKTRTAIRRVVQDSTLNFSSDKSNALAALQKFAVEQRRSGKIVLAYSGGLSDWQQFEPTVRLMSECVKAGLASAVVITNDPAGATRIIGPEAKQFHVTRLEQHEVVQGLRECDIGFLLRRCNAVNRVASPTKFFEYIAAGLLVVTTPGAATIAPLVEMHNLGLVLSESDEDLQLLDWIRDLNLTGQEKIRISELARFEYSWSACGKQLVDLYRTS